MDTTFDLTPNLLNPWGPCAQFGRMRWRAGFRCDHTDPVSEEFAIGTPSDAMAKEYWFWFLGIPGSRLTVVLDGQIEPCANNGTFIDGSPVPGPDDRLGAAVGIALTYSDQPVRVPLVGYTGPIVLGEDGNPPPYDRAGFGCAALDESGAPQALDFQASFLLEASTVQAAWQASPCQFRLLISGSGGAVEPGQFAVTGTCEIIAGFRGGSGQQPDCPSPTVADES